jgi:hypothetical protein
MHWMISSIDVYAKAEWRRIFDQVNSPHLSRYARHLLPQAGEVRSSPLPLAGEDALKGQVRAVQHA